MKLSCLVRLEIGIDLSSDVISRRELVTFLSLDRRNCIFLVLLPSYDSGLRPAKAPTAAGHGRGVRGAASAAGLRRARAY